MKFFLLLIINKSTNIRKLIIHFIKYKYILRMVLSSRDELSSIKNLSGHYIYGIDVEKKLQEAARCFRHGTEFIIKKLTFMQNIYLNKK